MFACLFHCLFVCLIVCLFDSLFVWLFYSLFFMLGFFLQMSEIQSIFDTCAPSLFTLWVNTAARNSAFKEFFVLITTRTAIILITLGKPARVRPLHAFLKVLQKHLQHTCSKQEGGVKGCLNNVKKTALLEQGGFPYHHHHGHNPQHGQQCNDDDDGDDGAPGAPGISQLSHVPPWTQPVDCCQSFPIFWRDLDSTDWFGFM